MKEYSFEKLLVWQRSREFVKCIYETTYNFPDSEKFGLISQLRRASVSISSNIAEGSGRVSYKDKAYFTQIAFSSLMEVLNQLYLSLDLKYIDEKKFWDLKTKINELSFLISKFRNSQLTSTTKPIQPSKHPKPVTPSNYQKK